VVLLINFLLHLEDYIAPFIQAYGAWVYTLLFAVIFVETGLVIMPILPGDSLIFIAGTIAATGALNPYLLFILLSIAAILGDSMNYWIGKSFGLRVFSRFINQEYLDKTRLFFHNHGRKTIVLARFMPIIRTFAPFIAGIGEMNYLSFLSYNIIGGIVWVGLFVFSGYYFGNIPFVKDNLTIVILLIILISFIPAIIEYIRHLRRARANKV